MRVRVPVRRSCTARSRAARRPCVCPGWHPAHRSLRPTNRPPWYQRGGLGPGSCLSLDSQCSRTMPNRFRERPTLYVFYDVKFAKNHIWDWAECDKNRLYARGWRQRSASLHAGSTRLSSLRSPSCRARGNPRFPRHPSNASGGCGQGGPTGQVEITAERRSAALPRARHTRDPYRPQIYRRVNGSQPPRLDRGRIPRSFNPSPCFIRDIPNRQRAIGWPRGSSRQEARPQCR